MAFTLVWLDEAADTFRELEAAARKSLETRTKSQKRGEMLLEIPRVHNRL